MLAWRGRPAQALNRGHNALQKELRDAIRMNNLIERRTRHIKRAACALVVGCLTMSLVGCGFQLRGKVALDSGLTPVAVAGNDEGLAQQIRESLTFSGAQVSESTDGAASVVRLIESSYKRNVRTTNSRGLATSYLLVYSVRFDAVDRAGKTVMKEGRLRLTRDLDFDANQILQKEDEQRFLIDDMRREIAQSILRRLSASAAAPWLGSTNFASLPASATGG